MAHRYLRLVALVCVASLATACGSDAISSPATPVTDPAGGAGGWIGGEPEWYAPVGEGDTGRSASGGGEVLAAADTAAPAAVPPGDPQGGPLRAGSVDDNADFAAYLEYAARLQGAGVVTRPFDATGRIVVTVTDADGRPAPGVAVTVSAGGGDVATVRTTADGTARFLPALYGTPAASYDLRAGDATATAAPGDAVRLAAPGAARAIDGVVALDVLFLLDATGSMGDEIGRLKVTIDSVAERLSTFDPRPDLRLAMTLYRDEGDTFVTSSYDFTGDVDAFRAALDTVVADGGGDYPEALEEGLAEALAAPAWRDPATTTQLVFLVADAPPRLDRQVPVTYPASIVDAVARGIKIFPIASSESDDQAEAVFRQLALSTGARFVFLSYGAGGAATGPSTDIRSTDYEELALDDLVVRLVAEELAALTGTIPDISAPTTTAPTTNPPGQ